MTLLLINGDFSLCFQVDSDLIFDSIEETNSVHSHGRHQRDLTSNSRIEESKSSHADEDDDQHWFSGALHRIRRHIGSIFSAGEVDEKKHKRRTRQEEDDNFLEQEQDEYEDEQENVRLRCQLFDLIKFEGVF